MRRVVITGMGTVNPIGKSVAETWENAKKGVCGIGPITQIDVENHAVKLAGEIKDFDVTTVVDKKEARHMARFTQLGMVAADEAMKQSKLDMEKEDPLRCGIIFSSGIGGLQCSEDNVATGERRGYDKISPFYIPMTIPNMSGGQIAIKYGFKGMCTCVVTACASSNNAIGDAFHYIRDGYAEVMLAGGSESCITHLGLGGFTAMTALNKTDDPNRASIPFDAERGGFVMAEGAGILVLEEYEHAKARGAEILGEVVGYGATCDAHHITAPDPEGNGGAAAMAVAIKDAGITPEQVGYINAHGTSTHLNDAGETKAIKKTFGDHAYKLMVSSTKSMTGHLLGGAGAVEAIFSAMALKDGFIPATINYRVPDPECDLDIVPNEGRNVQVEYALSNSLGFGGHNASVLFKKYE
ncbi:MAG: beta-ketoacyl-ACP synthase II [Lachnospiraceae bacterium]|nr:beta-ketoacyl-ACP synthase II [Lachnospiraceae bacterium]